MLQALKSESAPAPVKVRPGTGSDPADSAFAGLMAQAASASMILPAPQADLPREDRNPEPTQRVEAPAASRLRERPSSEKSIVEPPRESEDPAKAAATAPRKEEAKPADTRQAEAGQQGTAPSGVDAQAQAQAEENQAASPLEGSGTSAVQLPQNPPAPQAPAENQAAKVEPQDGQPEAQAAKTALRAEAALKGLPQEIQPAEADAALPAKPPLTELLSLPKGEIQTPKLNPGSAKVSETASKLAVPAPAETGTEAGINPGGAEAAPEKPVQKSPVAEELPLLRPEVPVTQIQTMKHAPLDSAAVSMAEGAKAAQSSSHVQAASAPARPSPVFSQVEGSIRWILHNKAQGAELQLHPESLGRMVIQLRVEGQEVHARLWASEPTSLAILQDHKAFLESSLREQGLNLGSFDLQSGTRGDGAQTASQERAPMNIPMALPIPEVKQEMPIEGIPAALEAHRIEVFA